MKSALGYLLNQKLPLRSLLPKYANRPLFRKTGQVSACCFCSGPGGLAMLNPSEPFRDCLLEPCGLVGLMDASPTGFQNQMFQVLVSQVEVLKVGAADWKSQSFTASGEAGRCEFPPGQGLLHHGWDYGKTVSQLLLGLIWVFSHLPSEQESGIFWIFFRGNCLVSSC